MAASLINCLQFHGIDEFLRKASVYECEAHVNTASEDMRRFRPIKTPEERSTAMTELGDARRALKWLHRCVQENKNVERAFDRFNKLSADTKRHRERTLFRDLADEVRELDEAVLRDVKVLEVAVNLILDQGTNRQASYMIVLTVLMALYASLSLAASVFGMNIQELNGTGQDLGTVALCLVFLTEILAFLGLFFDMISRFCRNRLRLLKPFLGTTFQGLVTAKDTAMSALRRRHVRSSDGSSETPTQYSKVEGTEVA